MYITKQILNQQSRNKVRAHKNSLFKQIKINQLLTDTFATKKNKRNSSLMSVISLASTPDHKASIFKLTNNQRRTNKKNSVYISSGKTISTQYFDKESRKQRNTVNHMISQRNYKQADHFTASIRSISQQSDQKQQKAQIVQKNDKFCSLNTSKVRFKLQKLQKIKQKTIIEMKLDQIVDISHKFSKKKTIPILTQEQQDQLRTKMFRKTMRKCGRQNYILNFRKTMKQFTMDQICSKNRKKNKKNQNQTVNISQEQQKRNRTIFTQKSDNLNGAIVQQSLPLCNFRFSKQSLTEQNQPQNQIPESISRKCLDLQMNEQDNEDRIRFRKYILHSVANAKSKNQINQNRIQQSVANLVSCSSLKQSKFIKTMKRLQETKNVSKHQKVREIIRKAQDSKKERQQRVPLGQKIEQSVISISANEELLRQNCYLLQKFIRGGMRYDHDQYSDYTSLSYLNQTKQNFRIFSDLYRNVKDNSNFNNLSFQNLNKPDLQSMVYLNEKISDISKNRQQQICRKLRVVR